MSALTRREFIALSSAAACWPAFGGLPPSLGKKLLPDYWCTWTYQNELAAERNTEKSSLAGDQGAFAARNFAKNGSWYRDVWNRAVMQCAPAVVARGLALPKVRPLDEDRPFVVAGRHPGETAVGTLPRLREGRRFATPPVEIALAEPIRAGSPLGVFGEPRTVLVPYRGRAGRVGVSVQDLAYGRTVRAEANAADGVLRLDVAALKAAVAEDGKPAPAIALTLSA